MADAGSGDDRLPPPVSPLECLELNDDSPEVSLPLQGLGLEGKF